MKILFDEDAPRPFRRCLPGHEIDTVQEMGWAGVKNGKLLNLAEESGFDILLTFDQNLAHQQNMTGRKIAVVVIKAPNKKMETLILFAPQVLQILPRVQPGQIVEIVAQSVDIRNDKQADTEVLDRDGVERPDDE